MINSFSQCYNKYSTSSDMTKHERTQNYDKPFSCSICDYKYRQLHMKEPTLEINYSAAVEKCCMLTTSADLKRHERNHNGNNHSAASSVINPQHQVAWRNMKETTMVIKHSAAYSVINNQHQVAWRKMKYTTLVTIHSAALWLQMQTINSIEDTWKSPHWR